MCESFRPSRWQVLRYLILPHIVPYVLMTTKSTVGYAMRMLIFAELIGSAIGIGAQMGLAQATFHMESVIAWTVLLIAINLVVWAWELIMFRDQPVLLGTALLAYGFGLRHAVDALR